MTQIRIPTDFCDQHVAETGTWLNGRAIPTRFVDVAIMVTSEADLSDTHAHGIAKYFLRTRAEASMHALARAHREFDRHDLASTRKGIRRLLSLIHRHLGRHAWAQESWTDRHATKGVWLLPEFDRDELTTTRLVIQSHARQLCTWRLHRELTVPLHAIARSHQRLHRVEWERVEQELRICAIHAKAVHIVSRALDFEQFGIPAFNGLLVGDVEETRLRARTYLTPPFSRKYRSLLDVWTRFSLHRGHRGLDDFRAIAFDHDRPDAEALLVRLASELASPELAFLGTNHEPGNDHVGLMWETARSQCAAEYAAEARTC